MGVCCAFLKVSGIFGLAYPPVSSWGSDSPVEAVLVKNKLPNKVCCICVVVAAAVGVIFSGIAHNTRTVFFLLE